MSGIFNAALGSPPTQSHDTPVYAYPTSNPSKFKVSRLIRYTDGAGQILDQGPVTNQFLQLNARRHIFNIDNPNFNVAYGDVLLHMEIPNQMGLQWMKNYAGQIGLVPRCMLQYIKFPYGLPSGVPLVEQGVKLDIAFTNTELFNQNGHQHFDDMTPLLVMKRYVKKEDNTTGTQHVVDIFTNRARHVAQSALDRPLERPWDVLVAEDTLRTLFKDMGRMRGTVKPGLPPKFQFVDLPDWNAAVSSSMVPNTSKQEAS